MDHLDELEPDPDGRYADPGPSGIYDPARPRRPRRPFPTEIRVTTRTLMVIIAVVAVEWLILIESHKLGPGIEFTLFMAAVLGMLDLLIPGCLAAADRINSASPDRQPAEIFNLGCLICLVVIFSIPVIVVGLLVAGAKKPAERKSPMGGNICPAGRLAGTMISKMSGDAPEWNPPGVSPSPTRSTSAAS